MRTKNTNLEEATIEEIVAEITYRTKDLKVKKINLTGSKIRNIFLYRLKREFDINSFTKKQAKEAAEKGGLTNTEFQSISTHLLKHCKIDKDLYSFTNPPVDVNLVDLGENVKNNGIYRS